jgi:hypothetical protein
MSRERIGELWIAAQLEDERNRQHKDEEDFHDVEISHSEGISSK